MGDESIWKKEISFGRKRKTDAPTESAEHAEEPTSVWKKEISFGRKKRQQQQQVEPEPEVVAEVSEEPEPPEETWTRAVSFGRKAQPEDPGAVGEAPAAETPAPVVELPVAQAGTESHESDAVEQGEPEPSEETWTRAVSFGRKVQPEEPAAVSEEPAAETRAPLVELPVAQARTESHESDAVETPTGAEPVWTREVSFSAAPAQAEPAPATEEPKESHEAGAVSGSDPEPAPERAAPETVPAVPEPAPGVHAPVTADELPPLDEAEPEKKVPFWKKEIGGKKKPKTERAPKQPKAKKEKAPKQPKVPKERKPKATKVRAARGSRGAKRITGLKIGASQLAAARVANNGSAELLQIARTSLEPGIVVGGELRDPDALAAALKEFFAANSLPKKGVRLGIANNRIGVRTFEIGGIADEKQLANAIRFRAQEALPIPIDEAVLDYQVLGEGTDDQGQPTKRILLVVAYRELIDRYLHACKKAGISLVGIDLEAFALLRALQAPQDGVGGDSAAALVAVAIGHDRSTFAVSDGRTCEFTRVVEWGGSALNVAIARALDAAPSEVDGVKRALALTDEMVPEGLTDEQAKKARDAMRRAIQTFARELVSSLQYYQNQPGSLGIGEIVLTGGTAHLAGLAGELERLIGVRVRVGDPLARMKVSKKVGEAEQVGSLAVAIGLGIED
jgi:type IV pilus assembly protein PilM